MTNPSPLLPVLSDVEARALLSLILTGKEPRPFPAPDQEFTLIVNGIILPQKLKH